MCPLWIWKRRVCFPYQYSFRHHFRVDKMASCSSPWATLSRKSCPWQRDRHWMRREAWALLLFHGTNHKQSNKAKKLSHLLDPKKLANSWPQMYVLLPICIAVGCVGFQVTRHGVEMDDLQQEGLLVVPNVEIFMQFSLFWWSVLQFTSWLVTICWRDRHFETREAFLWCHWGRGFLAGTSRLVLAGTTTILLVEYQPPYQPPKKNFFFYPTFLFYVSVWLVW